MRREEFTVETAAKTKHKISPHKVLFTVLLYLLGITMLTPLLWMISTSFSTSALEPINSLVHLLNHWIYDLTHTLLK